MCGSTPHFRDTKHLFLELSLLRERLEEYICTMSDAGFCSQNAIQATRAWLKEGLKARCITRDLKWGVPVPQEKFKDKVKYLLFVDHIIAILISTSIALCLALLSDHSVQKFKL